MRRKSLKTSKYYGVSKSTYTVGAGYAWRMKNCPYVGCIRITGRKIQKIFKTELEAAKWVDIQLMRAGKEPRNIYKKTT